MKRQGVSTRPIGLSVVIPVLNEADNVLPLLDEILNAIPNTLTFEVLFIDDGSTDDLVERLAPQLETSKPVRLIRHARRGGQSAAIRTGVKAANGTWIATLDGDGQNDPADIMRLLELVRPDRESGPTMAGGIRTKRRDTWSKRMASMIANRIRGLVLNDGCPDTGCGLKVFRRDAFLDLPFFSAQHRFLPALFRSHGHDCVYAPVNHRSRNRGVSKYNNLRRGVVGFIDLLGVVWLIRRTRLVPAAAEWFPSAREHEKAD